MKNKNYIIFIIYAAILQILVSCDFSSHLKKDILDAQQSVQEKKYQQAIYLYESLLAKSLPAKVRLKVLFQLGEIYLVYFQDAHKAGQYFDEIKKETEDPHWLVRVEEKKGEISFSYLKDFPKAIESYAKLGRFLPPLSKQDFYELRLGISYLEMLDLKKAMDTFQRIHANQQHQAYISSFYYIGILHYLSKQYPQAIRYWNEYIKKESRKDKIVQTRLLMGNAYETMEKLKEAYDIYYSLLGEFPNTAVIKERLKSLYARKIARKR